MERMFGRAVTGTPGQTEFPQYAADNNEVPTLPGSHGRQQRFRKSNWAEIIRTHDQLVHGIRCIGSEGALAYRGVVHHDVHCTLAVEDLLNGRGHGLRIAEIERTRPNRRSLA